MSATTFEWETDPKTPNIPALRKVWEWIEEQAKLDESVSEWWQYEWRAVHQVTESRCLTTYCAAGKAVELSGLRWVNADPDGAFSYMVRVPGAPAGLRTESGEMEAAEVARRYLGLYIWEADDLFDGDNDVDDMRAKFERILARAGEKL